MRPRHERCSGTGIILIVIASLALIVYASEAANLTVSMAVSFYTALLSGIGLIILARRIVRLEKE